MVISTRCITYTTHYLLSERFVEHRSVALYSWWTMAPSITGKRLQNFAKIMVVGELS